MREVLNLHLQEFARSVASHAHWDEFKETLDRFYFEEWQKTEKPELREQIHGEYKAFRRFAGKLEALNFNLSVKRRETG